MPKKIILFPFGGNARESLLSIFAINHIKNQWDIIGFIDDDSSTWGKSCCGIKVKGGKDIFKKFSNAWILAVPGNPNNYLERKTIIKNLKVTSSHFATIIHPSVIKSTDATIGYNVTLMPNIFIGPGVRIGNHCIILANTVIAHDSVIGDYCCIGSNVSISGNVSIGPESYIGSGVNIRENISIGEKTLIGLGSNVLCDIKEAVVAAGNPCQIIRNAKIK